MDLYFFISIGKRHMKVQGTTLIFIVLGVNNFLRSIASFSCFTYEQRKNNCAGEMRAPGWVGGE